MSWFVVDLETTVHEAYKRKSNVFLLEESGAHRNHVVLAGWCTSDDPEPYSLRLQLGEQKPLTERFIKLLGEYTILVGQNVGFDIQYLIRDPRGYAAYQAWVAQGGMVWDIQLAEYTLQGQARQSHMLSMNEIAEFYGEDMKIDEVKKLWEAGVQTEDIDPDLLDRYLIGEELVDPETGLITGRREGDIGITRNIFLKQVQIVRDRKMGALVVTQMKALMASIEMERNGMFVDVELGHKLAAELLAEKEATEAELTNYLPVDIPFEFNWTNRYHLSPLIFGGTVRYKAREYYLANGTFTFEPPVGEDPRYHYATKEEVHYVLPEMTYEVSVFDDGLARGEFKDDRMIFKAGKNAGEFKTRKVKVPDYTQVKSRWGQDSYTFPGFTKPRPEWESSTPGLHSVANEVIEALTASAKVPFLKTLGRAVRLQKDLGTYFITTDDKGAQKGMLTLVDESGIVHQRVNHTSTVTGRLSISAPNLQNVPKGDKSKAKEMFVSRFPGGKIIQSDFSSLEVYVQANITGSKNLLNELLKGTDLHCLRLSKKEHMDYEEVLRLAKGWKETLPSGEVVEHAKVKEWDYKRTGAKVFSFQLAYGAGAQTIADATGMDIKEVEELMKAEAELFPEIGEYFGDLERVILENAKPTNHFVMHPDNPAVRVQTLVSRIKMPTGKLYTFNSSPAPKFMLRKGVTSSFSPTERKNYPVQGEGGEIMKCAMALAIQEFSRCNNFGGRALLVNTVHDALYVDSHPDVLDMALAVVHACMERATDLYCHHHGVQWSLPVPSDTSYGDSMAEEIPAKINPALLGAANETIRDLYLRGYNPSYLTKETT